MKHIGMKFTGIAVIFILLLTCALEASAAITGNGVVAMSIDLEDAFEDQALTYARILCLKHNGSYNGTLIITCDQHSWVNGEQVWPIYRSTDGGNTWTHITDVTDTLFGTTRKAQPMLYELPHDVGDLEEGTLLLTGNLVPYDQSSSRLVIYKSTDCGNSWTYLSTVDTGGPFIYDPSPTSTTTTVWEPFLYVDDYGHLVCAFSDERQKEDGVLQALSLRYSSDGVNWSDLINIVAIDNLNDRPGMITVSPLPNGKYIATYEVVNRPSYDQNSSVVYYKFSDDGITWDANDLGILAETKEGLCLGSSPYVKWVDAGGPNGMIIIGSKWAVNENGDIQDGGQNFFVNYNLGEGYWERLPQPLTWDGEDITYLDAFSQCIETNVDNTVLYEAANMGNLSETGCEVRVGTMPLTMGLYEAENATLTDVSIRDNDDASNGLEVGYINYPTSVLSFDDVKTSSSGTYVVYVRYNNGTGSTSFHSVSVNGSASFSVNYPATVDWNRYQWTSFTCSLNSGLNTIDFRYNGTYAEIDCIAIYKSGTDISRDFMIKNRNSGKFLETPGMSMEDNTELVQWSDTDYPCQIWNVADSGTDGYYTFTNKNSGKRCQIYNASMENGAAAVQYTPNSSYNQQWSLEATDSGYFHLKNRNSGKLLEIMYNLTTDGAAVVQWDETGYPCQEWTFIKEGIQ
jgi:hypothetical protein